MNQSWVLLKQMNEYLASFLKYFLPTLGITIPLLVIIGVVYFVIKYGFLNAIKSLIDQVDYIANRTITDLKLIIDFLILKVIMVFDAITAKANEIAMLINVFLLWKHPPEGDIQMISLCCLVAVNLLVLINKGKVLDYFNSAKDTIELIKRK